MEISNKRIRVLGSPFEKPILDTTKANLIEFYDDDGNLEAILSRVLGDNFWSLSTIKDSDWIPNLLRLGYYNKAGLIK